MTIELPVAPQVVAGPVLRPHREVTHGAISPGPSEHHDLDHVHLR